MTKIYLTIDTEYEVGFAAQHGVSESARVRNFARAIEGRAGGDAVGLGYHLDVLDAYDLKAVFFVDPMPALVWGTAAITPIVEHILVRGHDVQLHIHTEWLALAGNFGPVAQRMGRNIKDYPLDEQIALIEYGCEELMAAGAAKPVAFRAGNYGANDDTLRALARVGLKYDTSHAPGIANGACAIGLGPEDRRPVRRNGVVEVPVGCIQGARGLRHAQLTALSARELREAAIHARDNNIDSFTLVSHSFELLSRDRTMVNRLLKRRFERLCIMLATTPGLHTATYAEDPPRVRRKPDPRPVLPRDRLRSGARVIEQAMSNALYGGR